MADRFPAAPATVRAASVLLIVAAGLGIVLTGFAAWSTRTVPAGVGALVDSLSRDDRWVLRGSWVLHRDRPIPLLDNLPWLIWLGLSYLLLLPMAYFVRRGFSPARTVVYVFGGVLVGLTVVVIILDENFGGTDDLADPGPDQLSPQGQQAWSALFPPGYLAVHVVALVGMIACGFLACLLLDRPVSRAFMRGGRPRRRRIVRASNPRLRLDGWPGQSGQPG